MKDLERRRRVMERSIRLGHCICDPKKGCPCPLFKEKDVCLCAGERMAIEGGEVRLTRLVEYAGCASKIDQSALKKVLGGLSFEEDPRVLVGVPAGDDAGVFRIDGDRVLVQTVDVFSPSVDDPYVFGQIAAANSVSDIYAMGGQPLTALSILGFPIRTVPDHVMREILRGGIDKMAEAKVAIIGGHSINDKEIKAGFAVTGLIDPSRILTNAAARPGDALVLTKPIGTGILAFASQIDRAPEGALSAAAKAMATLNKTAAEVMVDFDTHACTDITGFGLIGHLANVAIAGGVDLEIVWDDIPLFPGVLECVVEGVLSGAAERNRESSGEHVVCGPNLQPGMLDICFDPQTSGGLLIAVAGTEARALVSRLHERGVTDAAVIGHVTGTGTGKVHVRSTGSRPLPPAKGKQVAVMAAEPCCAGHEVVDPAPAVGTGSSEAQRKFQEFLKAANTPGALDARTKQAIAVALSIATKCEPCTKIHMQKARDMGFTPEEIDEAAWMAIAFGGSPLMMFYNAVKNGMLSR